ncbi:TolC family protein [Carboxylicivirga sp. M1479]|uniref:TolC family protein n=1 Tax=Carboxylicivirga sp. M1479 TaxID=2594476 RepID=UPI001177878A|nr:TolC family protein [Carboxylicivirga sp. M1479]TRX71903.1 TolC family protein [Carboxylicivirga sp. M1479]
MHQIKITILFCFFSLISQAQSVPDSSKQIIRLNLKEAIQMAKLQSLSSFRSKNMYIASYWDFRSYKASQLPGMRLSTTPINYNRSISREYNSNTNTYEFISNETLSSNLGVSVDQNLTITGGQLSVASNIRRLENMGSDNISFTTVPISIRLSQPLNGYNKFKWQSKLKPLEFEKAKKTFLAEMEALSEQAVRIFFNSIGAEIDLKIAETNLANADTLFNIGKGRFQIGTVTQDELLDLELTYLNAKMAKTKSQVNLQQARNLLNSFLGFDKDIVIIPLIPDEIPELKVNSDKALELAKSNNPQVLELESKMIRANENIAKTKSTSGLSADLNANLGINKQSDELQNVYAPPFGDDRGLGVTLNAPIIDWGTRRGQIQMAKSNKQVAEAEVKQAMIDFEQDIIMQVLQFNLQEEQVLISSKADNVAQLGYNVTKQRFMIDKVDVIRLNAARNSLDGAKRRYIDALSEYWRGYYNIRQITLFDFEQNQSLIKSLDYLLEQ